MPMHGLPLLTGLLPILAIHVSLLIAIEAQAIPACIPYVDGCVSISATGRYEPASFLFKPAMIFEAALMIAYWMGNRAWLDALAQNAGSPVKRTHSLSVIGTGGAVALIVYVTFLGTQTEFYEFMRRFGVYLYFLLTIIAQLMLARMTFRIATLHQFSQLLLLSRVQWWLAIVPFLLGALNLALKSTLDDADAAENVIEWIVALAMHLYFLLSWQAWKVSGFRTRGSITLPK